MKLAYADFKIVYQVYIGQKQNDFIIRVPSANSFSVLYSPGTVSLIKAECFGVCTVGWARLQKLMNFKRASTS